MVTRRKILVCLQLVVVLLMVLGATPASADRVMPENKTSGKVDNTARHLKAELKKRGFEVGEGYFQLWGSRTARNPSR